MNYAPVVILILSQIADVLLTHYAIVSGLAVEINPLGYSAQAVILKTAATALVVVMMIIYRARLRWLIWLPGVLMYLVVFWNSANILMR